MKILIAGANGMIGHRMFLEISKSHEVLGICRRNNLEELAPFLNNSSTSKLQTGVNLLCKQELVKIFSDYKPDFVLNCVGSVKQIRRSASQIIETNSLFPHVLANICEEFGSRLIQFSTDCVFSGKKGCYTESDQADADDLYGRSKTLGEVLDSPNALTIRTSTIGREVYPHGGLLEWLIAHKGKQIEGFSNAIYSGFPTKSLANILIKFVLKQNFHNGLVHLASEPINKYDLLNLINEKFDLKVRIVKNSAFKSDKSLAGGYSRQMYGDYENNWGNLVKDLEIDWEKYEEIKK